MAGQWYKANLHSHTSGSDGRLPPGEVALNYRRNGYQVLAITDHNTVTPCREYSAHDFVCIEGIEIGVGKSETGSSFHIVGISVPEGFGGEYGAPQALFDAIADAGGVGFIAHPYWSCLVAHDMLGLRNCLGIEVYNHGCELEIAKGISSAHWDDLLVRGERTLAFAVDDGHWCGWDYGGGFTMIRAEELSREAILQALRDGDCYASMGPLIHDLQVTEEGISVESTPAAAINFVADNQRGWCAQKGSRPPLTGARYLRSGNERHVRVEIVDETGLKAWSQPVFLDK